MQIGEEEEGPVCGRWALPDETVPGGSGRPPTGCTQGARGLGGGTLWITAFMASGKRHRLQEAGAEMASLLARQRAAAFLHAGTRFELAHGASEGLKSLAMQLPGVCPLQTFVHWRVGVECSQSLFPRGGWKEAGNKSCLRFEQGS